MLEINAWKREKDLSHQQQNGVIRGAGKKTWQPNLYSALNGSRGVFPNPSNPTSLALLHSLAHAHSFEKHLAGNPSKASTSQR